jgi:hypothetical protein
MSRSSSTAFVVVDSPRSFRKRLGERRTVRVTTRRGLDGAFRRTSKDTVWIVNTSKWVEPLLRAAMSHSLRHQRTTVFGDLLMLEPAARTELLPQLHSQFRRVVGEVPYFRILPLDQLAEVLSSKNKSDLFVGGIVDRGSGTVTLARGDLSTVTIPLSLFASAGPSKPDFGRFDVDDFGYALRFGEYEASAHSVLYEIDPDYRRRANQRRIAEEQGFGPSLRRLRILRRLSRSDFPGISPKTIARIERAETAKPHGKTLQTLARVLGVAPSEIEGY